MADDKRLERLFNYTKWHIGIYLSAAGGLSAFFVAASEKKLGDAVTGITYPLAFAAALVSIICAGIAGAVVATSCIENQTYRRFWCRPAGAFGIYPFPGAVWVRIEHGMFWISLICLAIGVLSIRAVHCWLGFNPLWLGAPVLGFLLLACFVPWPCRAGRTVTGHDRALYHLPKSTCSPTRERRPMDDQIKACFESYDKRLEATEKRFDDVKWYIGGATGVFTLIFSVLTVIGSLNFNAEKEDLGRFETNIRTDLGTFQEAPVVHLLGADLRDLSNQDVEGKMDGATNLVLSFVVSNVGNSWSGQMFVKFYSTELNLGDSTSDELQSKYTYEDIVTPDHLFPNNIPGKFSSVWHCGFFVKGGRPRAGRYQGTLKVFYGAGKSVDAPITVVVGT
jgi:hypothetical protein